MNIRACTEQQGMVAKENILLNHEEPQEEDLLPVKPVETAYSCQIIKDGMISPLKRSRKCFGTAPKERDNTLEGVHNDNPVDSQASLIMVPVSNNGGNGESPPKKRSWELDDDVEEEGDVVASTELALESQDRVRSDDYAEDEQETEERVTIDGADETDVATRVDSQESQATESDELPGSDGDAPIGGKDTTEQETSCEVENLAEENKEDEHEDLKQQPDINDMKLSIDNLFCEADKETVTVKNIFNAVEAEYSIILTKANKKILRAHLVALISGEIKPSVGNYVDDVEGDEESESSSDESSEDEEEEASSEYEDEGKEEETKKVNRRRTSKKIAANAKKESISGRRKSGRKPRRQKKSSIHEHAEKLRQKRMLELRVRNEELQLAQSKVDQERAELIAAKFETNTDELRLERFEARLDLLQRLDRRRLKIIETESDYQYQIKEASTFDDDDEEEEEDSDGDMELDIVGAKDASGPLFSSITAKPTRQSNALSVLDLADKLSPLKKDPSKKDVLAKVKKQRQLSPSRCMNAKAMLRNNLIKKQRKIGNMWLARELGYKNEQEHLRDCFEAEKRKRELVLKLEAQRLAANEKNQLRERLREPSPEEDEEEEELNVKDPAEEAKRGEDDDDEELQLAKELEKEQDQESASDAAVVPEKRRDSPGKGVAEASSVAEGIPPEHMQTYNVVDSCTKLADKGLDFPIHDDYEESQAPVFPDAQKDIPMDLDLASAALISSNSQEPTASHSDTQGLETQKLCPALEEGTKAPEGADALKENSGDDDGIVDTDDEAEFDDNENEGTDQNDSSKPVQKEDRNAAWKAMLQKEAEKLKNAKKRKGANDYLEMEAEEEEEEEVAGLEDFGFSVHKKKQKDDDDDDGNDEFKEDDLKDVVDDVSDDEGDEEAGEKMRRAMAEKEEKERHKEILRRMREGYDGRRGGIAGGGAGARGVHRFDQLVAADNREAAKQNGLLNDDETDSDDEGNNKKEDNDEEEDEAALLDKYLKTRFSHRSSVEVEENWSGDEEEEEANNENDAGKGDDEDLEQEHLAKRFAKRARMQRLIEEYGDTEEFSNSRLIEEDTQMKEELARMKNGLARKRSITTVSRNSSLSTTSGSDKGVENSKRQKTNGTFGAGFLANQGSLSLALQSSRQSKSKRTSFLGSDSQCSTGFGDSNSNSQKSVVFQSCGGESQLSRASLHSRSNSQRAFGLPSSKIPPQINARRPSAGSRTTSLWSKVMTTGPRKRG